MSFVLFAVNMAKVSWKIILFLTLSDHICLLIIYLPSLKGGSSYLMNVCVCLCLNVCKSQYKIWTNFILTFYISIYKKCDQKVLRLKL